MAIGSMREHLATIANTRIDVLISEDPLRHTRYCVEGAGVHLDYSKHLLNDTSQAALFDLARRAGLKAKFRALTQGESINRTENRAALHTLLRGTATAHNQSLYTEVTQVLERMQTVVSAIHNGSQRGFRGDPITDVVNIGIGGSDLGPRMVCHALRDEKNVLRVHFVANVDPWDLDQVLSTLDPAKTLFIVCSKSFTTAETLSNALRARQWLMDAGADVTHLPRHVLAVTTNLRAASEFGIGAAQCFPIWDWVGGRYSLWSAIGISIALQCGWATFESLLAGARAMDAHTLDSAPAQNLPMVMALLEWWHCQVRGSENHLVLPYSQRLATLTDFLQQLTMESNGKRVTVDGEALSIPSAPMLWGSAGTIGQHSYYQLLHQGNRLFTADILLPLTNGNVDRNAHRQLAANALAQSRALLVGRSESEARQLVMERGQPETLANHLQLPGNHSHSIIWFDAVSAYRLGGLIAAYEHKTFFTGQLLNINSFDQWGVELGKVIGQQIEQMLSSGEGLEQLDPSTASVVQAWRDAN